MKRRKFLEALAAGTLSFAAFPGLVRADDDDDIGSALFSVPDNIGISANVVVVGGGMAGVTLAKYLRLWGGSGLNVTLIESAPSYTSNIMSNKVLTGQLSLTDLNYTYDTLTGHYGVNLVQGTVTSIDPGAKTVSLAGGGSYSYDRLVLAPGLQFDLLSGMNSSSEYDDYIPHAWKAGPQTQLLRDQLLAMPNGAPVVVAIPKAPYRCPPGPYERACVIADWLTRNKPASQLTLLDANADILVQKQNFQSAFDGAYGFTVNYQPKVTNLFVINSVLRQLSYTDAAGTTQTVTAGVFNPIPPQRAPALLAETGLYDPAAGERSVPVDVRSYEATHLPGSGIHVIGDASFTTQPKAGHIGNQQGKTCADAIVRLLKGQSVDSSPVTNSACFTPITSTRASWMSGGYQYDPTTGKMVVPSFHNGGGAIASTGATEGNYEDMQTWFRTLMSDTFG